MAKEQKRKLENNWKVSENQENEIASLEKKITKNNPSNIIRKNSETIISDKLSVFAGERFYLSHTFEDLPEWTIPHFRLKYFFETEDGYIFSDLNFISSFYDIWTQDGDNYIFSIVARVSSSVEDAPYFFTSVLIFDNPRSFNELQFNKA